MNRFQLEQLMLLANKECIMVNTLASEGMKKYKNEVDQNERNDIFQMGSALTVVVNEIFDKGIPETNHDKTEYCVGIIAIYCHAQRVFKLIKAIGKEKDKQAATLCLQFVNTRIEVVHNIMFVNMNNLE
ncbi:hypothetical protein EB001_00440 [bacterium]|nr:hypothetical protein [bacterium]